MVFIENQLQRAMFHDTRHESHLQMAIVRLHQSQVEIIKFRSTNDEH